MMNTRAGTAWVILALVYTLALAVRLGTCSQPWIVLFVESWPQRPGAGWASPSLPVDWTRDHPTIGSTSNRIDSMTAQSDGSTSNRIDSMTAQSDPSRQPTPPTQDQGQPSHNTTDPHQGQSQPAPLSSPLENRTRYDSLESALLAVEDSHVLFRRRGSRHPDVVVKLLASPASGCAILLYDGNCDAPDRGRNPRGGILFPSLNPGRSTSQGRITVEMDHTSSCSHAILRHKPCLAPFDRPHPQSSNSQSTAQPNRYVGGSDALIKFVNSSQVTFRGVEFDLAHFKHLRGLLSVERSSMLMFEQCSFRISDSINTPNSKNETYYGVKVQDSFSVLFVLCTFEGTANASRARVLPLRRPYQDIAHSIDLRSALEIFTTPPSPSSPCPSPAEARRHWKKAICWLEKQYGSYAHRISFFQYKEEPHLIGTFIERCKFSGIGQPAEYRCEDQRIHRIDRTLGYALDVKLRSPCQNRVVVTDSLFASNHANYGTVVKVTIALKAHDDDPGAGQAEVSVPAASAIQTVSFSNTVFHDNHALVGGGLSIVYSSSSSSESSNKTEQCGEGTTQALHVYGVELHNCTFEKNEAGHQGGAVYLHIRGPKAALRQAKTLFNNTKFVANTVPRTGPYVGAAIFSRNLEQPCSVYTWMKSLPDQPTITFSNCTFTGNEGEDGVVYVWLTNLLFHNVRFEANKHTAVVACCSNVTFTGEAHFISNRGRNGGVMRTVGQALFDLEKVHLMNAHGNVAENQGSIYYGGHESSAVWLFETRNYNEHGKSFDKPKCPLQFPKSQRKNALDLFKWSILYGQSMNKSTLAGGDEVIAAYFMASWVYCYQQFDVPEWPLTILKPALSLAVKMELQAFCMPYGPSDRANVSVALLSPCRASDSHMPDKLQLYGTNKSCREDCMSRDDSSHLSPFGITIPRETSTCNLKNAYLSQPFRCGSVAQCLLAWVPQTRNPVSLLGSAPAWLFFKYATTTCFKTIGTQRILYFKDVCNRSEIVWQLQHRTTYDPLETDCGLLSLARERHIYRDSMLPFVPGYPLVLTPWSSHVRDWSAPMLINTTHPEYCIGDTARRFPNATRSISKITLNPAPGEVFSINVQPADEWMNWRHTWMELTIQSDDALLGTGTDLAPVLRKTFHSDRGIQSMRLLGVPGSSGNLLFTVKGDLNVEQSSEASLRLTVPFHLRACHMGFRIANMTHSKRCEDCPSRPKVHLAAFIFLVIMAAMVIVLFLLAINFGMTSTLDSWLYFAQAFFILHGQTLLADGSVQLSTVFILFMDRIFCPQGITRMVTASSEMIVAMALFLPVILILLLTKYSSRASQLIQRFQRRNSIRHVFWLLLIVSISLVVNSMAKILKYARLGEKLVPYADGSITYFSNSHRAAAVMAIVAFLIVVGCPFILLALRPVDRWPALIGFIDEAVQFYRPRRWWWVCVNILRRVVLALLDMLLPSGPLQWLLMLATCSTLLTLHSIIRPLKHTTMIWKVKDFDNRLESALLITQCFLYGFRLYLELQCPLKIKKPAVVLTIFAIVSAVCMVVHFSRFFKSWWDTLYQKPRSDLRTLWRESSSSPSSPLSSFGKSNTHISRNANNTPGLRTMLPNDQSMSVDCRTPHSSGHPSSATSKISGGQTELREPLLMESLLRAVEQDDEEWRPRTAAV
ncbi:uncharacterized protein LOC135814204 isoform X2 [Sycon ciliatum]|uniref:uncharacterized protein LOC135814204 isoform X2 n=1 Tax=Sycon ciliatum TaxID=27933 RepID=UPI0031F6CFD8